MLEVSSALVAERARLGIDKFDEMWEGELHMVPAPSEDHQRIGGELFLAFHAAAKGTGMRVCYETGVYDPAAPEGHSWRVPDLVVFAAAQRSDRGVEGAAALVVEIRSPGDESLQKLGFYQRVGVREVLVIDRDTKQVRHSRRAGDHLGEQRYQAGTPVTLAALAVTLQAVDGQLVVDTAAGRTLI